MAGNDVLHGARHAAQVGSFNVGVDIDDRLDVVMADFALLGSGDDGGKIRQNLHGLASARRGSGGSGSLSRRHTCRAARRRERRLKCWWRAAYIAAMVAELVTGKPFQLSQVIHAVLRRLDGDVVRNAVTRIEIKGGAGLEAAAQRHQQALRHILLRQSCVLGARAVHVHCEIRGS